MSQSFPVEGSGKSYRWAILLALLIDIPFLAVLLFSNGKFEPVYVLAAIIPLAISGLIIYASYTSRRMEYVLGEDEFIINFHLSPLKISYTKIRYAGKVETSLRFRIFGGSLPGSHWGLFFTSNLGNAQVYATHAKGEFLVLELVGGERVLISPREPDALIEALRRKTHFKSTMLTEIAEPRLDLRVVYAESILVIAGWFAFVYYVACVYPWLPEIIPVHFGLDGVPNRYGSKVELLIMVGVSVLFPVLNTVFAVKFGKYSKGLTLFLSAVFLFAIGLFAIVVFQIVQAM